MTTTKKGNVTIKNFKTNKAASIKYFNNIKDKDYVSFVTRGYDVKEEGYCVEIIYKKDK